MNALDDQIGGALTMAAAGLWERYFAARSTETHPARRYRKRIPARVEALEPRVVLTNSTFSFDVNDLIFQVGEGDGPVTLNVHREGGLENEFTVTVNVQTADSTAVHGNKGDYLVAGLTRGKLFFGAGVQDVSLKITARSDGIHDPDELLFIELTGAFSLDDGATATLTNKIASGIITDHDPTPTHTLFGPNADTVTESKSVTYTIALDRPSSINTEVPYQFATTFMNSTLNFGSDLRIMVEQSDGSFVPGGPSGVLTFRPDQKKLRLQIRVELVDDTIVEPAEVFVLTTGVDGAKRTWLTIIEDNDAVLVGLADDSGQAPNVSPDSTFDFEGEADTTTPVKIRLVLLSAIERDIADIVLGVAARGRGLDSSDYSPPASLVAKFTKGDQPGAFREFTFLLHGDDDPENTEQFTVSVKPQRGTLKVDPSGAKMVVNITDDDSEDSEGGPQILFYSDRNFASLAPTFQLRSDSNGFDEEIELYVGISATSKAAKRELQIGYTIEYPLAGAVPEQGTDFEVPDLGYIVIPRGKKFSNLNSFVIKILADSNDTEGLQTLDGKVEIFDIVLQPGDGYTLSSNRRFGVTITNNII